MAEIDKILFVGVDTETQLLKSVSEVASLNGVAGNAGNLFPASLAVSLKKKPDSKKNAKVISQAGGKPEQLW